jgi:Do/DeqQ family serine protease
MEKEIKNTMANISPRRLLTRAGTGAAVLALVTLAGYGVGQTQSSQALAVASSSSTAAANTSSSTRSGPDPANGSYAGIVNAAAPAVVTVRVEKKSSMVTTGVPQLPDDPMFREFFGRRFQSPRQQRIPRQAGLGSGVITTADGYILTNNHVIDGADRVRVELTDKRTFDAKVVGTDPASDLALLKVDAQGLRTLPIGDSNRVSVGDVVLAIGNPLGVGQTVTMGIISAKGRATGVGDGSYEDFLQTDAAINQGNSGGALISLSGELVGINSQILTPTGGNIGLGFAIPSNMARQVMEQLKTDGKVSRSKLGVTVQNVTADIAASLKLADVSGALVSGVEPGSAAARAGLRQGDVITAIDGEKLVDNNALRNRVAGTKPGSRIAIEILREGRKETLQATLDAKDPERAAAATNGDAADARGFGMTVQPLTPEVARELELTSRREGVVIEAVDPDGAAAAAGLQPGDVILQVNGQVVKSASELKSALGQVSDRPALLLVARKGGEAFVTLSRTK